MLKLFLWTSSASSTVRASCSFKSSTGRFLRFSSPFLFFSGLSIYCILSHQWSCLELLILLCFGSMFSFQSRCSSLWPMSGFPPQKSTNFTTAQTFASFSKDIMKRPFRELFFYSVYVIVKGVRWCERNGFTRRRRVFMRLQLCSSLSGLHVTPLKSRVLWQTCKVLCLDASEVLSSPTYFRGCFRKSDTYKTLTLQDIQFPFQI